MKTQKGLSEYQRRKEQVRKEAVEWQLFEAPDRDYSWEEHMEITQRFERLGRRYGLLREFRVNGIC